jgi:hypothetical protein
MAVSPKMSIVEMKISVERRAIPAFEFGVAGEVRFVILSGRLPSQS